MIEPESFPVIVGEYVKFKVALAPGRIVLGVVIPDTPNGPALTLIMEIVKLTPPTLLTIAVACPVLPTVTEPKLTLTGLTLICCGAVAALPVSATAEETPLSVMTVRVPAALPEELGLNQT